MTTEQLQYVRDRLAEGHDAATIQQTLQQAGYTLEQATELLQSATAPSTTKHQSPAATVGELPGVWSFTVYVWRGVLHHTGLLLGIVILHSIWLVPAAMTSSPLVAILNVLGATIMLFSTAALLVYLLRPNVDTSVVRAVGWSLRHILSLIWTTLAFIFVFLVIGVLMQGTTLVLSTFFLPQSLNFSVITSHWYLFLIPTALLFSLSTTLLVYTYLDLAALVAEGRSGFSALARSTQLIYGRWWGTALRLFILSVVTITILITPSLLIALATSAVVTSHMITAVSTGILSAIILSVLQLVMVTAMSHLYSALAKREASTNPARLRTIRNWYLRSLLLLLLVFVFPLFLMISSSSSLGEDGIRAPRGPGMDEMMPRGPGSEPTTPQGPSSPRTTP